MPEFIHTQIAQCQLNCEDCQRPLLLGALAVKRFGTKHNRKSHYIDCLWIFASCFNSFRTLLSFWFFVMTASDKYYPLIYSHWRCHFTRSGSWKNFFPFVGLFKNFDSLSTDEMRLIWSSLSQKNKQAFYKAGLSNARGPVNLPLEYPFLDWSGVIFQSGNCCMCI